MRFATIPKTAELMGLSPSAVKTKIQRGLIPATAVRKWGGRILVDLKALEKEIDLASSY